MNINHALKMRIAIVEDDTLLRQEMAHHLRKIGFLVFELNSGIALDDLLTAEYIDILVLDLNLPGEDGLQIAQRIRKIIPKMGIVMLTARSALIDRLKGYDSGADIYLSKPIAPEELVATLLSLNQRIKNQTIKEGWFLDLPNRSLSGNEAWQKVLLTHQENKVLLALIQAKDQTLSAEAIIDIFEYGNESDTKSKRALEAMISRLRKKIASISNDDNTSNLRSVWGVGYQLCLRITILP